MPVQYFTDLPAFAKLPVHLRRLVEQIEDHAGQRIAVEHRLKKTMACRMSKGEAVIESHRLDSFRKESAFHELLHLKRYFIDGA